MATTLSYGYIQPENGDKGSTWFPALNDNIQQLNDHTHDGITSSLIPGTSVSSSSVSIPAASWVYDSVGRYRQDVTVPAGYNMDSYSITFKLSTGEIILPSIIRISSSSFRIFGPDNTLTYTAVFK
jgi:hypothetical protein